MVNLRVSTTYIVQVIEVLEVTKITGGHKISVKAKTGEGKIFTYVFIKTKQEDADAIVAGYKWEMGCKPIAL